MTQSTDIFSGTAKVDLCRQIQPKNIFFSCLVVSPKKWNKNTYGFARAEVLGALSNAVFLVALCFSILVEALKVRTCFP